MPAAQRFIIAVLMVAAVLASAALGAFASLDRLVADARFALTSRPASGQVVFADIDAASLASVGVWPWPRDIHARLLDLLMEAGAAEVAFDIDFFGPLEPAIGRRLCRIARSGGGLCAARRLRTGRRHRRTHLNRPIPELAAHADAAAVNVEPVPMAGSSASRRGRRTLPRCPCC